MKGQPEIKLYGALRCHKTRFYKEVLQKNGVEFTFLDVELNKGHAIELRQLYKSGKLNFPTITVGPKTLRNPGMKELEKWIPNFAE